MESVVQYVKESPSLALRWEMGGTYLGVIHPKSYLFLFCCFVCVLPLPTPLSEILHETQCIENCIGVCVWGSGLWIRDWNHSLVKHQEHKKHRQRDPEPSLKLNLKLLGNRRVGWVFSNATITEKHFIMTDLQAVWSHPVSTNKFRLSLSF